MSCQSFAKSQANGVATEGFIRAISDPLSLTRRSTSHQPFWLIESRRAMAMRSDFPRLSNSNLLSVKRPAEVGLVIKFPRNKSGDLLGVPGVRRSDVAGTTDDEHFLVLYDSSTSLCCSRQSRCRLPDRGISHLSERIIVNPSDHKMCGLRIKSPGSEFW